MNELNQVVKKYLDANGIPIKFFSEYIGCERSVCSRWLMGKRKLNPEQIHKTHDFLEGKYIKTVNELLKEE